MGHQLSYQNIGEFIEFLRENGYSDIEVINDPEVTWNVRVNGGQFVEGGITFIRYFDVYSAYTTVGGAYKKLTDDQACFRRQ